MPKVRNSRKQENDKVRDQVKCLKPVKDWLNGFLDDPMIDWGTQKSAHQAIKFLELAEYEMWNMQWWKNSQEVKVHEEAEKETV